MHKTMHGSCRGAALRGGIFSALLAVWLLGMCLPAPARAGARLKFWVWTLKDRKKIEDLEEDVEKEGALYTLETEHWHVASEVDARFTAELAHFLELFIEVFPKIFTVRETFDLPLKPTAIVYASPEGYAAKGPPGSRGVFRYAFRGEEWAEFGLYSFVSHPEERIFPKFYTPVLLHEGTHLLFQGMVGQKRIPVWLNEGLASYFQFWEVTKSIKLNRKNRYLHSDFWPILKKIARRGKDELPPLAYLVGLTSETWDADGMGEKTGEHYALAESFVDYLLDSRGGRRYVRKMFERMMDDEPLMTEEEIDKIERRWHKHILEVTRE